MLSQDGAPAAYPGFVEREEFAVKIEQVNKDAAVLKGFRSAESAEGTILGFCWPIPIRHDIHANEFATFLEPFALFQLAGGVVVLEDWKHHSEVLQKVLRCVARE